MKTMLITGGTVFVSRFAAEYFAGKYDVFVLNRNTKPQCPGVKLIEADRHALGGELKSRHFDVVLDVTAYDGRDVSDLLEGLGSFGEYFLISSSAVYPETLPQPFRETDPTCANRFWGKYGTNKISAEQALKDRVPGAYILRPPYLYGPGNNVYRESFVFDCALQGRPFYLPKDGSMKLQFFHVEDLMHFVEVLLEKKPAQKVFNAGNPVSVSIRDWVTLCYQVAGKTPDFVSVPAEIPQRSYFPFYDYEYALDVTAQSELMPGVKALSDGLHESLAWYLSHKDLVVRKPFFEYISEHFEE